MKKAAALPSFLVVMILLAGAVPAEAQEQAKKMARIGYLSPHSGPPTTLVAFKEGLRELGWAEGKQIEIEYRYADGHLDKLSAFAAELVRLRVDVIVAGPGDGAPNAAKRATTTIPIVMVAVSDPVSNGLVASLARPGANVTGVTFEVTREQAGKNLELLKEAVPKVSRVAIVGSSTLPGNAEALKETELAAAAFGVKVQFIDVLNPNDIEAAFRRAVKWRADALLAQGSGVLNAHRTQVADLAVKSRLPAMYYAAEFVEAGGLMFYGVDFPDLHRRAATYVDKILKGANPAELPVEQPTKFELVINLKTAKQIGLTMPQSFLYRADTVIK
jgi:putative tryptophan/tyrosine transport system substrate-binding protein